MVDMKEVWLERLRELGISVEDLKTKAIKELVNRIQTQNKETLAKFLWKLSIYLHIQEEKTQQELENLYKKLKGD